MLRALESDRRAIVRTDTYTYREQWLADWDLHTMKFTNSSGTILTIAQATNRDDPLRRATNVYDHAKKRWSGWSWIDKNRLY